MLKTIRDDCNYSPSPQGGVSLIVFERSSLKSRLLRSASSWLIDVPIQRRFPIRVDGLSLTGDSQYSTCTVAENRSTRRNGLVTWSILSSRIWHLVRLSLCMVLHMWSAEWMDQIRMILIVFPCCFGYEVMSVLVKGTRGKKRCL